MEKMTLYKITEEQARLNRMLEESVGELTPELEEALAITAGNFVAKSNDYVASIHKYEAFADAAAAEMERLTKLKRTAENVAKRLKERLRDAMVFFGTEKVDGDTFRLSLRRSQAVEIVDERQIPADYLRTKVEVDKAAVRDVLKAGGTVPGAMMKQNTNLQIR